MKSTLLLLIIFVLVSEPSRSQEPGRRVIGRMTEVPVFDGIPDEAAWEDLPRANARHARQWRR